VVSALTWLLGLQWLGELLAMWAGWPLPGGLVGMAILLAALGVRGRPHEALRQTSHALLSHLMLLFVPWVAGILTLGPQLRAQWLPFLASCVLATALTMCATAWTLRLMLKRQAERQAKS